jgi:hypothetical protein
MNCDPSKHLLHSLRQLLSEMRGDNNESIDFEDGLRLIRAFARIASADDRRIVINLAERLGQRDRT